MLGANERALAPEDLRYLYEPSGWRKKGVNQRRAYKEFTWWKEVDIDDNDIAEFVLCGTSNQDWADDYAEHDVWWCYERGWGIMFDKFLDPQGAAAHGERLTKPIKLFTWVGNRSEKKWQTKEPISLRLWHAEPFDSPYVA